VLAALVEVVGAQGADPDQVARVEREAVRAAAAPVVAPERVLAAVGGQEAPAADLEPDRDQAARVEQEAARAEVRALAAGRAAWALGPERPEEEPPPERVQRRAGGLRPAPCSAGEARVRSVRFPLIQVDSTSRKTMYGPCWAYLPNWAARAKTRSPSSTYQHFNRA